jgi:hypothetical protein
MHNTGQQHEYKLNNIRLLSLSGHDNPFIAVFAGHNGLWGNLGEKNGRQDMVVLRNERAGFKGVID